MTAQIASPRLYNTLCNVLDALRSEAPVTNTMYHPAKGNHDALIQARSRALLHLFLKARFGLVHFAEREGFITDGKYDGGIDAFYIDQRNKRIYVLQSKFRATAANFVSSNMSALDLLKMDVSRILKGERRDENGNQYNELISNRLQKAIQKLTDAGSYTRQVVLLGNAKTFTKTQLKKLVDEYAVEQYSHERTYKELLFPIVNGTYFTDPYLTIEINLANLTKGDTHLDYEVKVPSVKPNVKLLFVPTREIGRVMHTYKNSILKFNPRSFLELKNNPVNKAIQGSIKNVKSNQFALFNNGITIVADGTLVSSDTAKQGTAQVVIRNPQLVNGAQTAYALGRIYEECSAKNDFSVFKGKEVLLKIITFVGSQKRTHVDAKLKLIGDISRASNSQTKVEESDRRSNDPIQLALQKALFEDFGLYYERKRGEFSDGIHYKYIPQELVINREKLIRVSLACAYRANQARSSISKFFVEGAVEQVLHTADAAKYAFGYQVMDLLDKKRKSNPVSKGDRYHTREFGQALRYGQYALVAVCTNKGLPIKKTEAEAINSILPQWIKFEKWAEQQTSNKNYKKDSSFDYVNYYKGSTVNADLQNFSFTI